MRGPPGGRQLAMGSSFNSAFWRYSYRPLAQGWKGATLPASAMFASRPSLFMRMVPAVFSTRLATLGLAQYPMAPGPEPSRTWPSGRRGVGLPDFETGSRIGLFTGMPASFLPLAKVMDRP